MITEDYCSYEVSKLLDEKGFDEETEDYYSKKDKSLEWASAWTRALPDEYYPCPTHQMAMKWLRKMHNVHIVIEYYEVDGEGFYGWIVKTGGERYHCHQEFSKDYEEAVDDALKYCLTELI